MNYKIVERSLLEKSIVIVCSAVLWITTLAIFSILSANTLLRYVNGSSLQWANEVPELLFPWLVMSGVVLATEKGSHIATVFLVDSVSEKTRRIIAIFSWVMVAMLYASLVKATWSMLEIVHDERTPILQVPGSVTYACVMIGMGFVGILALLSALRAWRYEQVRKDESDTNAQVAQG